MPSFVQRLGRILLLLALISACGGHWVVLQSVAWTNMLWENAKSSAVTVAIEKTFDGQHPCDLCKAIAQGKKSEKKPDISQVTAKFEFFYEIGTIIFANPPLLTNLRIPSFAGFMRLEPPPVPPPKSLLS